MTEPYDPEARRDTNLAIKLKERIRRAGPISVREYMDACLNDPEHGYYRKGAAIGREGDFITAPEISQIFGELIGLWAAVVWQGMGSPDRVTLVELGPGRGTLMADALRAAGRVPEFRDALGVVLVETNETLTAEQRRRLEPSPVPLRWVGDVDRCAALLEGPAIIIANEFLDTLPVAQFQRVGEDWFELGVGLDDGQLLQFVRLGQPMLPGGLVPSETHHVVSGAVVERQDFGFVGTLRRAAAARPCAMLFVDYGHASRAVGDTLQAVRRHEREHPLTSPGEADVTVQVDFGEFERQVTALLDSTCPLFEIDGPVTQAEFLGSLGIVERASRLMSANPAKAAEIEAGVARLIAPQGMGTRFLAVALRSRDLSPLPGFAR